MYLIIDEQYRIYKSNILSGYVRQQARKGNLSVVNLTTMQGINIAEKPYNIGPEWSDIQSLPEEFEVDAA